MRSIRPAATGIIFLAALTSFLIVQSPVRIRASAQVPGVAAGMNTFEATFAAAVKADGGKVTATVSAAGQPTINVSTISLADKSLVLRYSAEIQDQSFASDYRALTKDADTNVVIRAMLTTNLFKVPDAPDVIKAVRRMPSRTAMPRQAAGMWVTVELPQATVVSEPQFDSAATGGGRGAPGTTPLLAQGVGLPRGYAVHVSADGSNWGKPVVEGKGSGLSTIITLPPTRARFLRIIQTDTVANAPPRSIRNLRIYEAPPAAANT